MDNIETKYRSKLAQIFQKSGIDAQSILKFRVNNILASTSPDKEQFSPDDIRSWHTSFVEAVEKEANTNGVMKSLSESLNSLDLSFLDTMLQFTPPVESNIIASKTNRELRNFAKTTRALLLGLTGQNENSFQGFWDHSNHNRLNTIESILENKSEGDINTTEAFGLLTAAYSNLDLEEIVEGDKDFEAFILKVKNDEVDFTKVYNTVSQADVKLKNLSFNKDELYSLIYMCLDSTDSRISNDEALDYISYAFDSLVDAKLSSNTYRT